MNVDPRERVILLDVESRSRADLRAVGGRKYWEHPSSEVLCVAWCDIRVAPCPPTVMTTHEHGTWTPGDPVPWWVGSAIPLGAHNLMGFDRFALARLGWISLERSRGMVDTSELARAAGLPGALDTLGTRVCGIPKDKEASRFTKSLSRPSKAKGRVGQLPVITPAVMRRVLDYCRSDVRIIVEAWPMLAEFLDADLPGVELADRAVNDRGVLLDVPLAKRLLEEDARNAEEAIATAAADLWADVEEVRAAAMSPIQFCAHTGAPNAQKATLAEMAAAPGAHPLVAVRQALASIARGKLKAGLHRVSSDGRLRDAHRYRGAHTARWSQRGMQLHNLPRPSKDFENWTAADIDACAARVIKGERATRDAITSILLRACLKARPGYQLATCDFKGVEARALAWVAEDWDALDVFASDRDPYIVAATGVFGREYDLITKTERGVGKIAELALGYQGAVGALMNMAAQYGIDLDALGVDPAEVVAAWRKLHAPTVRFWYAFERAWANVARTGRDADFGRFRIVADDGAPGELDALAVILPSGRPIVYREPRVTAGTKGRVRCTYHGTKNREDTYGGKLTENAIQALCRDLMAEALVRACEAGLEVVLHVHDEIVAEVPDEFAREGLALLDACMLELAPWAEGFPIGVSSHLGRRYRK